MHVRQLMTDRGLPAWQAPWGVPAVSRYVSTGEKKSDKALLKAIRTELAEEEQAEALLAARDQRYLRVQQLLLLEAGLPTYYTFTASAVAYFIETGQSCTGHGRAVYAVPAGSLSAAPTFPVPALAHPRLPWTLPGSTTPGSPLMTLMTAIWQLCRRVRRRVHRLLRLRMAAGQRESRQRLSWLLQPPGSCGRSLEPKLRFKTPRSGSSDTLPNVENCTYQEPMHCDALPSPDGRGGPTCVHSRAAACWHARLPMIRTRPCMWCEQSVALKPARGITHGDTQCSQERYTEKDALSKQCAPQGS